MFHFSKRFFVTLTLTTVVAIIDLPSPVIAGGAPPSRLVSPNVPLVVAIQRGERSSQVQVGAGHDDIVTVEGNKVKHILASGLTLPCCGIGGLAPSPDGQFIAFSQEINDALKQVGQTEGLWVMSNAGGNFHRLLRSPISPQLGAGIGPVAWSPDRYTLAYAVNSVGEPQLLSAAGIWLTRYSASRPRLTITLAQLRATLPP